MRPLELELEGFTSFRTRTTIDFRTLDLFAITGATGSGKTSLLDAMVYALYGRAPRLNRDINQLVSRGQPAMRVRLDFTVGETVYRAVRSSSRTTKSVLTKAALERKEGGDWQALAGKAAAVEREVERLIGLDYESFIRAVVLPQGEFDQFLKGEPAQTTEVLSRLLRTQIYGRMRELARSRFAAREQRGRDLEGEREQLAFATAEARAEHETRLDQLTALARSSEEAERQWTELAREAEILARALTEVNRLRRSATEHAAAEREVEAQLSEIDRGLETDSRALSEIDAELSRIPHDEERYLALERAEGDAVRYAEITAALARAEAEATKAAARLAELEQKIDAATTTVNRAESASAEAARVAATAQEALGEIAARFKTPAEIVQNLESERRRRRLATERGERERLLEATRAGLEDLRTRLETARAAEIAAKAEVTRAEEELARLRRAHAAHELRAHLKPGEPCPVCAQSVARVPAVPSAATAVASAEAALTLAREQAATAARDATRIETSIGGEEKKAKEITRDISRLGDEEDRAQAELERYLGAPPTDRTLAELERALADIGVLEAAARDAAAAARQRAEDLLTARHVHDRLLAELDADTRAAEDRARRRGEDEAAARELHQRLAAATGPTEDPVRAVRTALDAARNARKKRDALVSRREGVKEKLAAKEAEKIAARAALGERRARGQEAVQATLAAEETGAALRATLVAHARASGLELPQSEGGEVERQAVEERRAAAVREQRDLAEKKAITARELGDIERAIERRAAIEAELEAVRGETALAGQLARDLQADRFVNYLHEEAIEVLAADANLHLKGFPHVTFSLMSEDRRFFIIDHANADERRSVRTLSGGETFTASLALAIAFAERLTELAGGSGSVPLESLFLDEGFGTLDAEHLDAVAGAIEALYGRGRTVGIITHIPELAQRMPARIVVSKQGNTSRVLVESG